MTRLYNVLGVPVYNALVGHHDFLFIGKYGGLNPTPRNAVVYNIKQNLCSAAGSDTQYFLKLAEVASQYGLKKDHQQVQAVCIINTYIK